ncbi:hypothetical protein AB0G67_17670 [Streptomyces sp. NPDC021056]|uniref:hypothetical protein n=1 Tax=Streptomyces sp. NPDC021056 TaxID=3155012 RepID=UPI00340F22D2
MGEGVDAGVRGQPGRPGQGQFEVDDGGDRQERRPRAQHLLPITLAVRREAVTHPAVRVLWTGLRHEVAERADEPLPE